MNDRERERRFSPGMILAMCLIAIPIALLVLGTIGAFLTGD